VGGVEMPSMALRTRLRWPCPAIRGRAFGRPRCIAA